MSNKILITGSNGFVGSFLVEEAIARGFNVFAGVRKSSNISHLIDPRINFLHYDFDNEDKLRAQLRSHNFQYIIHSAGITSSLDRDMYFKINAAYVRKFCRILLEEEVVPSKFVLISSLASYGAADFQFKQVLDSDAVPHPTTWYGESKLQAEQFVESYTQIPSLIFRPTAVYGPRDMDMLEVFKAINRGLEVTIGMYEQLQSFIYVKDLARVIMDGVESHLVNRSYFVSDGNVYPASQLNNIVKELLDVKTIKLKIPIALMKGIAAISEFSGRLRGQSPILNRNKVKEYFVRSFAVDAQDLKKDFNFAAQYDLKRGMEETINWYKQHKLL